jgi:hypothetical protein
MDNANEETLVSNACLANGEVEGKRGPVPAKTRYAPPNSNDLLLPGGQIVVNIGVVLFSVRTWHEKLDVLFKNVIFLVSEEGTSRGVCRPNVTTRIDGEYAVDCCVEGSAKEGFISLGASTF